MATETKIIEIRIDLLKGLEDIAKLQQEISKLEAQQKLNTKATADQKNAYAANTVTIKEYRSQLGSLVKESANEIKTTIEKVGYMQKLEAEVSNLTFAYKRLSFEELNDVNVGGKMVADLKAKRAELANLEQSYGNYSKNVGNYSSATKMLGINLGQVMKEMPNFAISARIGIMSLTNNLPMLAESIKAVRLEQQAMTAAGQKAPSMFSLISKSIFGLTGIMSIAMVLMQIFGADIIKWVGSLFKGEQAVKGLTNAQLGLNTVQETLNKTMKDGGGVYATAISDIDKLKVSLEKSKGSTELSKKALNDYNESLGHTFGKAKNVDEALKLIRDNEKDYVLAMQKMAFANAFFSQSAADALKIVEVNTNKNAEILGAGSKKYIDEINKAKKAIADAKDNSTSISEALTVQYAESNDKLLQRLKNAEKAYNDAAKAERERQIKEISNNQKISLTKAREYYNEYADIYSKNGWSFKENEDKKKAKATFDYEQELLEAKAKAVEDSFDREVAKLNAANEKKQSALDKAHDKGLVKEKQYNTLKMAYEDKLTNDLLILWDKYEDKRQKIIQRGIEVSIQALKDSLKQEFSETDDSVRAMMQNQANYYSDKLETFKDNVDEEAKIRKEQLDFNMRQELAAKELTEAQSLAITEKYTKLKKDIDQASLMSKLDMAAQITSGLTTLLGKETKAGKFAAAATVTIQGAQSAYKTGALAAEYFAAGNVPMGLLAGVETGVIIANMYKSIKDIYAVDTDVPTASKSDVTSTVTEKFHTGGTVGNAANTPDKSEEVTATLLKGEQILTQQQTGIFNSILRNIKSMGGSSSITNGVGVNNMNQLDMMTMAFSLALQNQKPQYVAWRDFKDFEAKMAIFEQNKTI